jgi:hypothetical protein
MLLKYVYLILFIILLGYIGKKLSGRSTENFTDIPMTNFTNKTSNYTVISELDVELLTNKDVSGSFIMNDIQGSIRVIVGKINIEFNIANGVINFNNLANIKITIEQGKPHTFKISLFSINNFIMLSLGDKVVYCNFLKDVGIPKQNVKVLVKNTSGSVSKLTSVDLPYSFYNPVNELYKINNTSTIWKIWKNAHFYSIKDISNSSDFNKTSSKSIILQNKDDYILLDTVLNTITHIKLDLVNNDQQWLNYGSTIKLINNKKQYLFGHPNLKYTTSGLPIVYADTQLNDQIIQWTLEDLENKKTGYYIKEGDEVYLKNNGMYLQIIKGNPISTSKSKGMEISLGPLKNENSKWIIRHNSTNNLLFKKDDIIYLFHPMTESYVYNTYNSFNIGGQYKSEVIGKNTKDVWTIGSVIVNTHKNIHSDTIDYYRYKEDKDYLLKKEKEWKDMINKEDEKVKEQLRKFNKLKTIEEDLEKDITRDKSEYEQLKHSKCPPRKICLKPIDYSCIPIKGNTDDTPKYEVLYEKSIDPKSINFGNIEKCKTINDIDITQSPYVKSKKYVLKNIPSAKDDNSIESI